MNQPTVSPGELIQAKYRTRLSGARVNIILIIFLTVVNSICAITSVSGSYFLFSATVPFYLTVRMAAYTGHLPSEVYEDPENGWTGVQFLPDGFFIFAIVVSVIILLLYALCYFFSKRHYGWMIVAAVMFFADTLALLGTFWLYDFEFNNLLDVAVHIWALVSFILAAVSGIKASRLPKETLQAAEQVYVPTVQTNSGASAAAASSVSAAVTAAAADDASVTPAPNGLSADDDAETPTVPNGEPASEVQEDNAAQGGGNEEK